MDALVGYTGFVGSNVVEKHKFGALYDIRNIESAFGIRPDLLVYSGVPAEMYLANNDPGADLALIENAVENIRRIAPKRLVLISTIAVLNNPVGIDEDYVVNTEHLTAYGLHRYMLEQSAQKIVPDCHILRLPALFGKNIKKNYIYDLIHFFPAMLNKEKYDHFSTVEPIVADCYKLQDNGLYKLIIPKEWEHALRLAFERLSFSALNFTDSRSVFQFYNLAYLWEHIEMTIANNLSLLHLATEPLSASEVYQEICGKKFDNEIVEKPFYYDIRTKYANYFGGINGYIFGREKVLSDLMAFIKGKK